MRACLQCGVSVLYLFCNNHTGYSYFRRQSLGDHGGHFVNLLGLKSHTIVREREMLWKIPKMLALRRAVWSSFLSQSEVL